MKETQNSGDKKRRFSNILKIVLGIAIFSVCFFVLSRELHQYHYSDIVKALKTIPRKAVFAAFLLTLLNYALLSGYDILAFRYIHYKLPSLKIALVSFCAYAFSNNIGFYAVSGSAIRYRLYSAKGVPAAEITRVIIFTSLIAFWIGLCSVCSVVFLTTPVQIPDIFSLPFHSVRIIGTILAVPVVLFFAASFIRRKPIRFGKWEFELPGPGLSIAVIPIAFLEWIVAGSIVFSLLPANDNFSFAGFISVFLLAQIAGLVSHVPGGLGIFEAVMLFLLPDLPSSLVFGSLILYRIIYYFMPFLFSAVVLGINEIVQNKKQLIGAAESIKKVTAGIFPQILGILMFAGGVILLFSAATPVLPERIHWLVRIIPLSVVELSHFLGSLAGMSLLILSWGIFNRLAGAYHLSLIVLASGAVFSVLKGFDFEEAAVLIIMMLALIPGKKYFYRKSSLLEAPFEPRWIAAVMIAMGSFIWLGFFAYKHIEYSHELWWRFSITGHASRFLRASVGIVATGLIFSLLHLLSAPRAKEDSADNAVSDEIEKIVADFPKTYANLYQLGDKRILLSRGRDGFIMYGVEGRSWIAMGDPVAQGGDTAHDLIWDFKQLSSKYGGRPVFYEVGKENLPYYIDAGMTILKVGEEARVRLEQFSLEGSAHKGLRYTYRKLIQDGLVFEVLSRQDVVAHMEELSLISESWLAEKNTREKGFSLGFFSPEYIKRFRCAVVRSERKIVAFANIWETTSREEVAIDLMRFHSAAPRGIMDFLFCNLMLWARQEGYIRFNIGMAPMSGFEANELAPFWNRFGDFIFKNGEHFYNFQGLRQYKNKFGPEWEPKYICSPGGMSVPIVFKDIAVLISGSFKGVFRK